MAENHGQQSARAAALAVLAGCGRRKVRALAADSGDAADALLTVAAGARREWTLEDWAAVLQNLDSCELSVADWLVLQ